MKASKGKKPCPRRMETVEETRGVFPASTKRAQESAERVYRAVGLTTKVQEALRLRQKLVDLRVYTEDQIVDIDRQTRELAKRRAMFAQSLSLTLERLWQVEVEAGLVSEISTGAVEPPNG